MPRRNCMELIKNTTLSIDALFTIDTIGNKVPLELSPEPKVIYGEVYYPIAIPLLIARVTK